jgi:hypothetical protein
VRRVRDERCSTGVAGGARLCGETRVDKFRTGNRRTGQTRLLATAMIRRNGGLATEPFDPGARRVSGAEVLSEVRDRL